MNENMLSLERKPKRLSMAGATRQSLLGLRGGNLFDILSQVPGSAKRRSTLLSTPASSKRRQSSLPPMLAQLNASNPPLVPAYVRADQRPLKDKNYQLLIQQEIMDFLLANRFEAEMNHPLTPRTLRQPTQKDFVLVFQFLYGKIDPHYKFTKSIQTEVTSVLRILNYPYLDGISRSQITAVGGSNWPAILGMLYWLVKLNLLLSSFVGEDLIGAEDEFDKHMIKFLTALYHSFMESNDNYAPYLQELGTSIAKSEEKFSEEITHLKSQHDELAARLAALRAQLQELQQGEVKSRALENDLIKFQAYLESMESRKSKWQEVLDKIEAEIEKCKDEHRVIHADKAAIEGELTAKGFTIAEIDTLNTERTKLLKSIDTLRIKLEDVRQKVDAKTSDVHAKYQSLDNFITQYNTLVYKLHAQHDFELVVNPDVVNAGDRVFQPHHIINKTLKDEKIELFKYRSAVNTQIHQDEDDTIKVREQCDLMEEKMAEQREQIETLTAKLNANKEAYDEMYQSLLVDSNLYSLHIERLEQQLRLIKINTNQGLIEIENKYQNLQIELDELNHEILKERLVLHDKIQRIIEFTINFKINIQQNLEDLDALATEP